MSLRQRQRLQPETVTAGWNQEKIIYILNFISRIKGFDSPEKE